MEEISVSFMDPMTVDLSLFNEWLNGLSEVEAARKNVIDICSNIGDVPLTLLIGEVKEQYVLFQYLKEYLQSPLLLNAPMFSSLAVDIKEKVIESYYAFDKEVVREFLGKKMNAKLRKDMDDVSEKTGVSLESCRRQFDNVKNIIKTYEDMDGCLMEILNKQFLFQDSLLRKYLPLIFVFVIRFETTKKRLLYLAYDDIINCAEHIIDKWTLINDFHHLPEKSADVDDIDRNFAQELRDLRNFACEKDFQDLHKSLVIARLEKTTATLHVMKSADTNFKMLSRNLFTIGAGLCHTKDVRDFFVDCVEKLIEPVKQLEWNYKDFDIFLGAFINSWGDIKNEYEGTARKFDAVYIRYLEVMKKCLLQMFLGAT